MHLAPIIIKDVHVSILAFAMLRDLSFNKIHSRQEIITWETHSAKNNYVDITDKSLAHIQSRKCLVSALFFFLFYGPYL